MKATVRRLLTWIALIVYGAILVRLIVFKAIPTIHLGHLRFKFAGTHTGPSNLVPLKTIATQVRGRGNNVIAGVNFLGNIIPFMPIGLLAPLAIQSMSWSRALALGIVTGLTCEVMEIIFRVGIFDVDDVMLNAFGVLIGYGVLRRVRT